MTEVILVVANENSGRERDALTFPHQQSQFARWGLYSPTISLVVSSLSNLLKTALVELFDFTCRR
jgi:hypothetical protein